MFVFDVLVVLFFCFFGFFVGDTALGIPFFEVCAILGFVSFDSKLVLFITSSFFLEKEAKNHWGNFRRFPQTPLLDSYAEGGALCAPFL